MLPSVTTHSSFCMSVVMSVAASKVVVFFVNPQVKSQWMVLMGLGYLISQPMLAVIKHIVDENITCLAATQLMHAPVHGACNTVQKLLHKTQLHFS